MPLCKGDIRWVDMHGAPVTVGGEMTANDHLAHLIPRIQAGELIGYIEHLHFRDPNRFSAGELHQHLDYWETIALFDPCEQHDQVLGWIRHKVSIFPYFQHFTGSLLLVLCSIDSKLVLFLWLAESVTCAHLSWFYHLRLNRLNLAYVMTPDI